jgi:hypothetical protein
MVDVLEQIQAEQATITDAQEAVVDISTTDEQVGGLNNLIITDVQGTLIFAEMPNGTGQVIIPACEITAVSAQKNQDIADFIRDELVLQPSVPGECDCCSGDLEQLLQTLESGDFTVKGNDISNIQNAEVVRVGQGIVILETESTVYALSTCSITSIRNPVFED